MENNNTLLKQADFEKIATEGDKIYNNIKQQYEPGKNGQFLAIEIESKDIFLAPTSAEAVSKAKEKHTDKIFYIVKIGYGVAETLAMIYSK